MKLSIVPSTTGASLFTSVLLLSASLHAASGSCNFEAAAALETAIAKERVALMPRWRTKAAQGDAVARYNLGRTFLPSDTRSSVAPEVLTLLHEAATQNNSMAIEHLISVYEPKTYLDGHKNPQADLKEAQRWWRAAFDLGDMGMSSYGEPTYVNLACNDQYHYNKYITLQNWRKDAKKGDAAAMALLGYAYRYSYIVPQDYAEAVKWLLPAANQDNSHGQVLLGISYYYGQGVAKDDREAMNWLRKVLNKHDDDFYKVLAQYMLGIMLADRNSSAFNEAEAVQCFEKVAQSQYYGFNGFAQMKLAEMYLAGRGVQQDTFKAAVWYSLSKKDTISIRSEFYALELQQAEEASLSSTQLAQARTAADEFYRKYNRVSFGFEEHLPK